MIYRSKAPLRIGFAGGGTDVSPYSDLFGGAILNATISLSARASLELIEEDKYVVLVWCNQIQKVVVKYVSNTSAIWMSDYSKKNYYDRKGVDGYSLKDYEEIKNKL